MRLLRNFDFEVDFTGKTEAESTAPPLFFLIVASGCLVAMIGLR